MEVLEQAFAHAQATYPDASVFHHAAFANSVAYLVTGWRGGYGGPNIREHTVSHAAARVKPAGQWAYDDACAFAAPYCFGALTPYHAVIAQREDCANDDPADVAALPLTGEYQWRLPEMIAQWNREFPTDQITVTGLARRIDTYPNRLIDLDTHQSLDLTLLQKLCAALQCRPSDVLVPVPVLPSASVQDATSQPLVITPAVFGANLSTHLQYHKSTVTARAISQQLGITRRVLTHWKQGKVHLLNRRWLWQLSTLLGVSSIDAWFALPDQAT